MSSVETLSAVQRRLNATIPQQLIRGEVEKRIKRIGRTAKVAGFRPGKVPFKILEQQYGAEVYQEVLGDALQKSFADVAEAEQLKVVGYPNFEVKQASAENVDYSATFEVYPEATLGDLSAQEVTRVNYVLSDADVDNTIDTLRKQRTTYVAADRAAQNDDQVKIDFRGTLDGEVFSGGEAKDYPFVLGQGRMLPDFESAVLGLKAGESKSFDMTFPADYHGKDVAGKQVTFAITVNAVEAPVLPEVDAEFAKSLGVASGDIAELRAEIRTNLDREIQRRLKVRNKEAAMDALLNIGELEVPKTMLDWEAQNLQQQAMRDMEGRGIKVPKGATLPVELFAERAVKRVKLGVILNVLVEQNGLAAKPEQVQALVQEYAASFEQPEEVVKWYAADPARTQEVENLALEDNVVAYVLKHAKVSDKAIEFKELMENN
ncbi:Trigger factor [Ferriphaselus amnicola]|uniref:Trigger factor n=1 Tax=Ferriphaselus amnicola TaxID=1188319 RepID=A0A2Z6G9P6_9PROT|nr:trigger factor [Ferriphaselus amnicola]BBE50178.1 Trigger factor [Ferriphaselus amnicola]